MVKCILPATSQKKTPYRRGGKIMMKIDCSGLLWVNCSRDFEPILGVEVFSPCSLSATSFYYHTLRIISGGEAEGYTIIVGYYTTRMQQCSKPLAWLQLLL
jgi:hypothetical protein